MPRACTHIADHYTSELHRLSEMGNLLVSTSAVGADVRLSECNFAAFFTLARYFDKYNVVAYSTQTHCLSPWLLVRPLPHSEFSPALSRPIKATCQIRNELNDSRRAAAQLIDMGICCFRFGLRGMDGHLCLHFASPCQIPWAMVGSDKSDSLLDYRRERRADPLHEKVARKVRTCDSIQPE